jgi:hypothetical protein
LSDTLGSVSNSACDVPFPEKTALIRGTNFRIKRTSAVRLPITRE